MKFLTIIFIFFNICFCSFSQTQLLRFGFSPSDIQNILNKAKTIDTTDSQHASNQNNDTTAVLEEVERVYNNIKFITSDEYKTYRGEWLAHSRLSDLRYNLKKLNAAIKSFDDLMTPLKWGEHITDKQIQKTLATFDNDTDKYIFNRCIECCDMIDEYISKPTVTGTENPHTY